jgi:hypothetical protein
MLRVPDAPLYAAIFAFTFAFAFADFHAICAIERACRYIIFQVYRFARRAGATRARLRLLVAWCRRRDAASERRRRQRHAAAELTPRYALLA